MVLLAAAGSAPQQPRRVVCLAVVLLEVVVDLCDMYNQKLELRGHGLKIMDASCSTTAQTHAFRMYQHTQTGGRLQQAAPANPLVQRAELQHIDVEQCTQ